jgi:hypothetical protein|tara:strand:+ start:8676 stop:8867 length:192 start_codon:yes stop_codon:yes gene_type:complete
MSGSVSKNDRAIATPDTIQFTTEERILFIAELIVNRMAEDEADNLSLLNRIRVGDHGTEQQAS